ncbi:hypothetical protein IV203_019494 [Nitzschia inconspicua]|uniref:Uncharacterized protein n=1 Tax=Nitzschia inconspicua TaxID=303405 RepID=A0A9K3LYL4_9STRA|nr:hypothetical protein IV203_019494 [Nitzschia inconspicua]
MNRRHPVPPSTGRANRKQQPASSMNRSPSSGKETTRTTPLGERLANAKMNTRTQKLRQLSASAKAARERKKSATNQIRKKPAGKRFRRVKVLRWWVMPATFFVPFGVLLIEYYLGKLISLDDVKDVYYQQLGMDPWDEELGPVVGTPPSITNMTYTPPHLKCTGDLRKMINVHNPQSHSLENRKIPMIVHQRAPSRCLTRKFYTSSVAWASTMKRWSYYFHDDDAVDRFLLDNSFPEFPLLHSVVSNSHCFPRPFASKSQLGSDLSTFLTLWTYGGVYADLNYSPNSFSPSTIHPTQDDAILFVDPESKLFSTMVVGASPRHPIMYFAIERILDHIVFGGSSNYTGSMALYQAFEEFRQREGVQHPDELRRETYKGTTGRTVRVMGSVRGPSALAQPILSTKEELAKEFAAMGTGIPEDMGSLNNRMGCLRQMVQG